MQRVLLVLRATSIRSWVRGAGHFQPAPGASAALRGAPSLRPERPGRGEEGRGGECVRDAHATRPEVDLSICPCAVLLVFPLGDCPNALASFLDMSLVDEVLHGESVVLVRTSI